MTRWRTAGWISLIAWIASNAAARADDADPKQACIAAAEQGQSQRDDGQYREARVSFLACAQDSCPKVVMQSCTKWLRELDESAPTVVLAAKDDHGEDLTDVRVTLDGAPFATQLDGKPIEADAGEHVLRFEREGSTPVDVKLLLRAGEKARVVSVTLRSAGAVGPGALPPPPEPVMSAHHVTSGVLFLGGLAAAGVGVYFLLKSIDDGHHADSIRGAPPISGNRGACQSPSATSQSACASLNSAVQSEHDGQKIETGLFIGGGALVVSAVVTWFAWPSARSGEPQTTAAIVPIPGGAAASFSGTF
jgi:hypothetical protein